MPEIINTFRGTGYGMLKLQSRAGGKQTVLNSLLVSTLLSALHLPMVLCGQELAICDSRQFGYFNAVNCCPDTYRLELSGQA